MEGGEITLLFIILVLYIAPLGLLFVKRIKKGVRISLLGVPLILTIIFVRYAIIDENKTKELYRKFPQANKIVFRNSTNDLKDSIFQLQKIMKKLPKRSDHKSVSYTLAKSLDRYNTFSFNWFDFDKLEHLEQNNNLHDFKISDSIGKEWTKYVNSNIQPFGTLTQSETKRFIGLIKYLDRNSLNAGNLEDNILTFDYNDSLRISVGTGFRTITLDTTGYYGPNFFEIVDSKDGFYLLDHK